MLLANMAVIFPFKWRRDSKPSHLSECARTVPDFESWAKGYKEIAREIKDMVSGVYLAEEAQAYNGHARALEQSFLNMITERSTTLMRKIIRISAKTT